MWKRRMGEGEKGMRDVLEMERWGDEEEVRREQREEGSR